MSVRESFVHHFGEAEAFKMEAAAREHLDATIVEDLGEDHFKGCIVVCIDFECFSKWRTYHGFTATTEEIDDWIINHGDLKTYDGDIPPISLILGRYNKYVGAPPFSEENEDADR